MEILLGNDNYFVEGKKNAAIYSLTTNKVFLINEVGKEAIIKFAKNDLLDDEQKKFIDDLISENLIVKDEIDLDFKFERPSYNIKFAWLELTDNCNLRCIHCYGAFGCPKIKQSNSMTTKDWFNAIDQLYEAGCRDIQLIGGEPFCYAEYDKILDYLSKKGFEKITMFTNATLISEKNIEDLKKYKVNIRFSLYGYDSQSHEEITKIKGSFNNTVNAIKLLNENGLQASVAVILMKENEKYIDKIKKFVEEDLKIRYNGYDVIRPSCVNDNLEHRITNYDLLKKRYFTTPEFSITKEQFISNHFNNSCFVNKLAITSTGDIIPCIFSRDFIVGNIRENTIKELKEKLIDVWSINKNKIESCKDCEYRYACSDCRPLSIGINGGKYSKYPRCCYDPEEGIWKDIKEITKEIIK